MGGGGKKGGQSVDYTPTPPSPEELELRKLLLGEAEQRGALSSKTRDYIRSLLGQDFSSGALTPEQQAQLDSLTKTYTTTRTTPLYEQADLAEKALRQRFANTGLADSSVAEQEQTRLQTELGKQISAVGNEASLFRYGSEQDLRRAALGEKLQKIGVLSGASDPTVAYNTLAALAGQRTAESNQALQIALANAQNQGGGGLLPLLIGGAAAAFTGGLGGAAGYGLGSSVFGNTKV